MNKLTNIIRVFKDQDYDRINNPKRLPIMELLPIGVSWDVGENKIELNFNKCAIVLPLSDQTGLAIVEFENFSYESSHAYVVNADGSKRFDVYHTPEIFNKSHFYDVYYIDNKLNFFIFSNNKDYRLTVDDSDGSIIDCCKSR
jgi:hypothetical protein